MRITIGRVYSWVIVTLAIQCSQSAIGAREHSLVVIKKPVVELNTHSISPDNQPACPEGVSGQRAHHVLFNQIGCCVAGDCVSNDKHEVLTVAYENINYGFDDQTGKPRNTFCLYRKHVELCSPELLEVLPDARYAHGDIIVLTYPWNGFSIGTRFKNIPEQDRVDERKRVDAYAILIRDYRSEETVLHHVPTTDALKEEIRDSASNRALFVSVINNLIDRVSEEGARVGAPRVIAYVLGGGSCIHFYDDRFDLNTKKCYRGWNRDGADNPYTGYDCSELVMRMAQIAGIHFPWKTTWTIQQNRPALELHEELQEGDLIWVKGHVMIVSSIERHELIEARGYGSGYGRVHRITLGNCFEGVETYADLLDRYRNQETIRFRNKKGEPYGPTYEFKLLKLVD